MKTIPPPPFQQKGMTNVRGLRPLNFLAVSPWGGPAEKSC